jgi:single-stranded DNA-binding protein
MFQNRVTLIGFLGKDAEKRATKNDTPYTVLSLATKDSWKDRAGEWQSRTEWHRCIVWGAKFAAFAADIKKGAHLQVEGELRSREYEKDAVKHDPQAGPGQAADRSRSSGGGTLRRAALLGGTSSGEEPGAMRPDRSGLRTHTHPSQAARGQLNCCFAHRSL